MRRVLFACVTVILLSSAAQAQERILPDTQNVVGANQPQQPVHRTEYETARQLVQRRALWKAEQRQLRLETAKWAGYSPSRPTTSAMPFMGSNVWVSGPVVFYPYPGVFYPRTQFGVRAY